MNTSLGYLPGHQLTKKQILKEYESFENWAKHVINSLTTIYNVRVGDPSSYYNMLKRNYLLSEGVFLDEWYQEIDIKENNNTTTDKFPTSITHYDIITPKISLLKGEEIKRPFAYKAVSINPNVVNETLEVKNKLIANYFNVKVTESLQKKGLIPLEQPSSEEEMQQFDQNKPKSLAQIENFVKYNYQSKKEVQANSSLRYMIKKERVQDKFNLGFGDLLISGAEIFKVDCINDDFKFRRVDPLFFECDKPLNAAYIHDSMWCREWRFLGIHEIYEEYYADLSPEDYEKLKSYSFSNGLGSLGVYSNLQINYLASSFFQSYFTKISKQSDLPVKPILVMYYEWVGSKKVGFVNKIDEFGEEYQDLVDEDYKKLPGEIVDWFWVNEVWEATVIGGDLVIRVKPKDVQVRDPDNISKVKLGYTGIKTNYPLVSKAFPIQGMYNVVQDKLKRLIARAAGSGIIFDMAQMPVSAGFDPDKLIHYMKEYGLLFINSFEEGKGKFAGKTPQFNQFQTFDLSLSQSTNFYLGYLQKLEMMLDNVTGVTKAREGQVSNIETLGSVERSVTQSSHITEEYFYLHHQVKRECLALLLEYSKIAWKKGKKASWILEDGERFLLDIDEDSEFFDESFGIFVSNDSKDFETFAFIKQLLPQMLQSKMLQVSDVLTLLEANSTAEAKQLIKLKEDYMQQLEKENQKAQQEAQQQQMEMQKSIEEGKQQFELQLKEIEFQFKEQDSIRKAETQLQVAEIQAKSNEKVATIYDDTENANTSSELGINTALEKEKLNIEQQKVDNEKEKIKQDANKPKNAKKPS